MNEDQQKDNILDSEWQDAFDDFTIQKVPQNKNFFQYSYHDFFNDKKNEKMFQQQQQKTSCPNQKFAFISDQQVQDQMNELENELKSSSSEHFQNSSQKNLKNQTNEKQKCYSKVYRQKVKQKYKHLQQQNADLKKRIFQLQSKLRQQQIQLNRFKFPTKQKQLSLEELNKQFSDLSVNYLDALKNNPGVYDQRWFESESYYHKFFVDFYNERGFAGKKKLKILDYHFNEILETIFNNLQKYTSLVLVHSEGYAKINLLSQFQSIKDAFFTIYKNDADLISRMSKFTNFLKPMHLELNMHISQFCKKYQKILECSHKIHNYLIKNYQDNMDIGRRRLEMQAWFDTQKYTKVMRKLRYQWYEWMKSLAQKNQQKMQAKKGIKKKKISQ